jgi:hypothetical protein
MHLPNCRTGGWREDPADEANGHRLSSVFRLARRRSPNPPGFGAGEARRKCGQHPITPGHHRRKIRKVGGGQLNLISAAKTLCLAYQLQWVSAECSSTASSTLPATLQPRVRFRTANERSWSTCAAWVGAHRGLVSQLIVSLTRGCDPPYFSGRLALRLLVCSYS